ncbi:MAG: GNAT family N-acetyltransferase [Candidatus Omnitrophica bacterium]|nr:GNAT family N-acetyltransferase [Candidatus Omnitrophota bacterium]
MLKKVIINKKHKTAGQESLSVQDYNLVFSGFPSIIDLPAQIQSILINNAKVRFKVISWCMFPVIWAGDSLKIELIKPNEAKIGDIVVYRSMGRAYCHRLVKIYMDNGILRIVTSGEKTKDKDYLQLNEEETIPAGNILGKVIEVKRGQTCFKPDELKLNLSHLLTGRIKLIFWVFQQNIKKIITEIFFKFQSAKLYRHSLNVLFENRVSFFGGWQLDDKIKEINNFCFFQEFKKFSETFSGKQGLCNISARINNFSVGNISLFFDVDQSNNMRCILFNLVVRIPFRGAGFGNQLVERALSLCSKANLNKVEVFLSEGDIVSCKIFEKFGFIINNGLT